MVTKTEEVDWSAWDGAWNLCAGQVTPWGTHLGGESHYSPFRAAVTAELADGPPQQWDIWLVLIAALVWS